MSRDYTHARRRADAGPVEEPQAPQSGLVAPTPLAVPVSGVARTAGRPIARKPDNAADPLGGTQADGDVVEALRRRRGGGSPLPAPVAQSFSEHLGTDLSPVRVHTDGEADTISRSVGAKAFTHGSDIYFTSGSYQTSGAGQHLLAHELAHVAQNATGQFRSSGSGTQIGPADDPAEKAADRTADEVVSALRRSPAPAQTDAAAQDLADAAADGAIRRVSVAELRKLYEAKIAQQNEQKKGGRRRGNAYATDLKGGAGAPESLYSSPELNEEKAGGRPAYAYGGDVAHGGAAESVYTDVEVNGAGGGGAEEKAGGRPAYAYGGDVAHGGAAESVYTDVEVNGAGGGGAEEKAGGRPAYAYGGDVAHGGAAESVYTDVEVNGAGGGGAEEKAGGRPAYAYGGDVAQGKAESVYTDVEVNGAGGGGAEEKAGGRPAYAYGGDVAQGKAESVYTEVEINGAGGGAKADDVKVEDLKVEEPKADESGADDVKAGGAGGSDVEDPSLVQAIDKAEKEEEKKAGGEGGAEHKPGDSRKHRGWLLSEVDAPYKNEEGTSKKEMVAVVQSHLDRIKAYWKCLAKIEKLGPADGPKYAADGPKTAADIKQTVQQANTKFPPKYYDELKDLALVPLGIKLARQHANFVQWLKRQDFPVRNDGTMDMKQVRNEYGEKEYDLSSRVVKYMTPEQRAASKVAFGGGVLTRDGNWKPSTKLGEKGAGKAGGAIPVDTDDSVTHFSGPGYEIFVASKDGEIYMTSHKVSAIHHSSLLAGADVLVAGEIKASHGRIVELTNKSGHYVPTPAQLAMFVHFLKKDGIPVDFKVGGFGVGAVDAGRTGEDLIAGRDAEGNVNPKLTYDAMKFKFVFESFSQQFGRPKVERVIEDESWQLARDGQNVLDGAGNQVDLKTVRKKLKEKLGGKPQRTVQQRGMRAGGIQTLKTTWTE